MYTLSVVVDEIHQIIIILWLIIIIIIIKKNNVVVVYSVQQEKKREVLFSQLCTLPVIQALASVGSFQGA